MVTLEFSVDGIDYKIERGRKPNILRFYVNNDLQKGMDDAQGENKETQHAIERVINMSADMFKHIVALNTYSEPFLALKTNEQRDIIEQLLGITLLSEKAEIIKNMIRDSKDSIQSEEYRVKGIEEANKRVAEQIESLKRRQKLWQNKHNEDLAKLAKEYEDLSKIDIEAELLSHKDLAVYNEKKKQKDNHLALLARQTAWKQKQDKDIVVLQKQLDELNHIDFVIELQSHKDLLAYNNKRKQIDELTKLVSRCVSDEAKEQKVIDKLKKEIEDLKNHTCYACGQEFHDDKHQSVLTSKEKLLFSLGEKSTLNFKFCNAVGKWL
jgi:DNA repair exonuclease SbcCD ATPase subunit